jgi:hypothetical protein
MHCAALSGDRSSAAMLKTKTLAASAIAQAK